MKEVGFNSFIKSLLINPSNLTSISDKYSIEKEQYILSFSPPSEHGLLLAQGEQMKS